MWPRDFSLRDFNSQHIERVAVRGVNWVGDAVMTVPALRDLRQLLPATHITLVTRPWARDIFEGADFIDDVLLVADEANQPRSWLRQIWEWRRRRFDLALLLPNAFAPALIAAAARVPLRVGYATQNRRRLLTHPFAAPAWRGERHEVFYYRQLVREIEQLLAQSGDAPRVAVREPDFALHVAPARGDAAAQLLRRYGVKRDQPIVALCPGSTNSRAKRWPAERYAALADQLIAQAGAQVIIIGALEESDVTQQVSAHMRQHPTVLTGEMSLAETVAVLRVVDLLITNDTGPAHIAAALGVQTLVIFGPTNPATTRPFGPSAEVVRRPPDCAPCMLRDCPIDHRCMTAISAEEIFARAVSLLERMTRRAPGLEVVS